MPSQLTNWRTRHEETNSAIVGAPPPHYSCIFGLPKWSDLKHMFC